MSVEAPHNEFEQWLRQQAEQHRLYPDESVWKRIQNRVHKRRWYPFVLTLLLITGGGVSWVMIDQPDLPINYMAQTAGKAMAKNQSGLQTHPAHNSGPNHSIPYRAARTRNQPESLPFLGLRTLQESNVPEIASENPPTPKSSESIESASAMDDSKLLTGIIANAMAQPDASSISVISAVSPRNPNTASNPLEVEPQPPVTKTSSTNSLLPEQMQTIESVVNPYKGKRTRKSWEMQLSLSPTVSYRKLIEDTDALHAARSIMSTAPAFAVPELNNVVKHKPDLGLQFGISVRRSLSDRLSFTGGFQFNINKYNIRAYRGAGEMATVGLSSGGASGSVSSFTNYRSSGGYWANWLANFYFTASLPIGFQYRIIGNKKLNLNIGSTIQPAYLLGNHAYVLSTDYKNYLEVPSLIRRWNVNGQFETFIGFQTGKTRWTLGPQARYQLLSSYEQAYPIQEHLFDIGIKLGVGL